MNGLLFAVIAMIALTLCINEIFNPTLSQTALILPFGIAVVSVMLGLISMFHTGEASKEKI
jgi:predicted tellurium resistance membrane protein TerC